MCFVCVEFVCVCVYVGVVCVCIWLVRVDVVVLVCLRVDFVLLSSVGVVFGLRCFGIALVLPLWLFFLLLMSCCCVDVALHLCCF